jgi:oligopeptide transport system ATP-binding protein
MKNPIISIKNLFVKFCIRGNIIPVIRDINFDIYENEILAIVGESGSGKSVLTKAINSMLESNGYIANGSIKVSIENSGFLNNYDLVQLSTDAFSSYLRAKNVACIKKNIRRSKRKLKTVTKYLEYSNYLYQLKLKKLDLMKQNLLIGNVNEKPTKKQAAITKQKIKKIDLTINKLNIKNKNRSKNSKSDEIYGYAKLKKTLAKHRLDYVRLVNLAKEGFSYRASKKILDIEYKISLIEPTFESLSDQEKRAVLINDLISQINTLNYELIKLSRP